MALPNLSAIFTGSKLERSKILEMSPTRKGSFMFLRFEALDLLPED
jgi:hypothetical protein